jgi:hypothetical protein
MMNDQDETAVAEILRNGNVSKSTAKDYAAKVRKFRQYIQQSYNAGTNETNFRH